jgi:hypothetical protein
MLFVLLSIIGIASILASNGGGGGGNGDGGTTDISLLNGIWQGTAHSNLEGIDMEVIGLIYEGNVRFYLPASDTFNAGTISVNGDNFSATLTDIDNNESTTLSGSYISGVSITGTYTSSSGDSGSTSLSYDSIYNRPSSLSQTQGTWSFTEGSYSSSITIQADGTIAGSDSNGCTFSGSVTLLDSTKNLYNTVVQITNCGLVNEQLSGWGVVYDKASPNDTLFMIINNSQEWRVAELSRQPEQPPAVDYSALPTTPLAMSTSAADTSITDAALELALNISDLSGLLPLFETVLDPFDVTPYANQSCPGGGTSTLTINNATPGMLSAGDSYTISYDACIISDITYDGSLSTSIVSVGLLNDAGLTIAQRFVGSDLELDYNNMAISDASTFLVMDGDRSLSADDSMGFIRFVSTGISLAVASDTETVRITNYTQWVGSDAAGTIHFLTDYGLASTTLDGTMLVTTLTPFEILSGDQNPSTGAAMATGEAGNGVRLTALDATQVQLDYEFTGDGQFDDHSVVLDWTALAGVSTVFGATDLGTLPLFELPLLDVK